MVVPYQMWMLDRIAQAMAPAWTDEATRADLHDWLSRFPGGPEILDLDRVLEGARVEKRGARLHSVAD